MHRDYDRHAARLHIFLVNGRSFQVTPAGQPDSVNPDQMTGCGATSARARSTAHPRPPSDVTISRLSVPKDARITRDVSTRPAQRDDLGCAPARRVLFVRFPCLAMHDHAQPRQPQGINPAATHRLVYDGFLGGMGCPSIRRHPAVTRRSSTRLLQGQNPVSTRRFGTTPQKLERGFPPRRRPAPAPSHTRAAGERALPRMDSDRCDAIGRASSCLEEARARADVVKAGGS